MTPNSRESLRLGKKLCAKTAMALSCLALGGSAASCGEEWQEPIRVPAGAVDLGLTSDYQTRSFKVQADEEYKVDCGASSMNGDHDKFMQVIPLQGGMVQVDCHGTGANYPVVYSPTIWYDSE